MIRIQLSQHAKEAAGDRDRQNEHFLASDASPIIEYTKEVVYVNDYEIAIVRADELVLKILAMKTNSIHYKT
jgi:glucosamine 6-phosphate synthetase-like amidotransferase/phosphosugar isomerase protein